jgi:hypothetical protein
MAIRSRAVLVTDSIRVENVLVNKPIIGQSSDSEHMLRGRQLMNGESDTLVTERVKRILLVKSGVKSQNAVVRCLMKWSSK